MRTKLRVIASVALLLTLTGCEKAEESTSQGPTIGERRVVLYTSSDDSILHELIAAFESETGIDVLEVREPEATGAVGLSARLIEEKAQPRADVWWSSEPFSTVRLASEGLLEPYTSASGESSFVGGWPPAFRASDATWYAFALRARVIAYDTRKLEPADVPRTLRDLAEPRWQGKVGMARPLLGTTLGQVAALVSLWGEEPTRQWLTALEAQGLRLYEGNSSVVRALADGEIEIGLTDSDDVWRARARGLPVGLVYEAREIDSEGPLTPEAVDPMVGFGALVIPNTAALVQGGPNPVEARLLLDFLISESAERRIMSSDSRNVPIRESAARELFVLHPEVAIDPPAYVNLEEVGASIETARRLVQDVFGG